MRRRGGEPFGRDSLSPPKPAGLRLPPHGASVPPPFRNVPPGMRLPGGFRPGRAAGLRGTGTFRRGGQRPAWGEALSVEVQEDGLGFGVLVVGFAALVLAAEPGELAL